MLKIAHQTLTVGNDTVCTIRMMIIITMEALYVF